MDIDVSKSYCWALNQRQRQQLTILPFQKVESAMELGGALYAAETGCGTHDFLVGCTPWNQRILHGGASLGQIAVTGYESLAAFASWGQWPSLPYPLIYTEC